MFKRKRSKWVLAGLSITLGFTLLTFVFVSQTFAASCFTDTEGHWAETYICWMFDNGLSAGFPDGTYRPADLVNRAQMAVFLQQLSGHGTAGQVVDADLLDSMDSTAFSTAGHNHWGDGWSGTGTGLTLASTDASGFVNALWGESASSDGNGVYGYATSTTGPAYGVVGRTDADEGVGVAGWASSTSGATSGVEGINDSTTDFSYGVFGFATGTSGYIIGIGGQTPSPVGVGAVGYNSASSGYSLGVHGQADSPDGLGVWGYASTTSTSGVPIGVLGQTESSAGWGVFSSGDMGASGDLYVGDAYVDNLYATYSKSALVSTKDYGWRALYAVESPENWFEDFGTGTLAGGFAEIMIEPIFGQTVNLTDEYHVFLTPLGDCPLFVASKAETSFAVQAMGGSSCNIDFDYRIVAKRLGHEDIRLESIDLPEHLVGTDKVIESLSGHMERELEIGSPSLK